MLISHRYKFIYLKTTKTASTSVEIALAPYALPKDFGQEITIESAPIVTEAGIVGARGKDVFHHQWYSHMTALKIRTQIHEDIWNSYFKFCNIRNPWDRMVSHFHFKNREIKNKNKECIFRSFKDWLAHGDKPGHNRAIYYIDNSPAVDDVIRYENLVPDFNRICGILGIPDINLPCLQSKHRGMNKIDFREYYDPESRILVEELFDIEIRQYGWSFE